MQPKCARGKIASVMNDEEEKMNFEDRPQLPPEVDIFYQKAPDHRTVKADGAWAGITPQLDIQFALYNDLQPMPTRIRHRITPEGQLTREETERDVNVGIERQVIATVVMNPVVAMQFVNILQQMIEQVHKSVTSVQKSSPAEASLPTPSKTS